MPFELLMTRGSGQMACRDAGLCTIGDAVAELLAGYEFAVESEPDELESLMEMEAAFAICV